MAQSQHCADEPAAYYNVNLYEEIEANVTGVRIQAKPSPIRKEQKSTCSIVSRYSLVSLLTTLLCVGVAAVLAVTGVYPGKSKSAGEEIKKPGMFLYSNQNQESKLNSVLKS